VDAGTADDAAIYRIAENRALVATVDFFTPIVDDAFDFGRIAAANALSDVYAMGGRPLFALNLVAFPRNLLKSGLLDEIVRGGGEVAREAGIAVVGGHSVDDPEPKYGLCVIGEVDPSTMVRNTGAQPGDVLVLTKPVGTGVIATAIKKDAAPADVVRAAVENMVTLNRGGAEAMRAAGVHAATDVTGYGLLGHLRSMLQASGVSARVRAMSVPLLRGAFELCERGFIPGGTSRNQRDVADFVSWSRIPDPLRVLLSDAQTSGGLLISVAPHRLNTLLAALAEARTPAAAVIGGITAGEPGTIQVT
jgi:selenide,water dikinase